MRSLAPPATRRNAAIMTGTTTGRTVTSLGDQSNANQTPTSCQRVTLKTNGADDRCSRGIRDGGR